MRWTLKPKPEQFKIDVLTQALQVDDIVATLLLQRGIETYEEAEDACIDKLIEIAKQQDNGE